MIARAADVDARLLNVQEVAHKLGVPVSWVYAASEASTLPSFKIGRYVRFRAEDIEAFIAASRRGRS